jgi:hypothetical protein
MVERTVRDFVTQVGMTDLMGVVGVKPRMIRHVATKGKMPATWGSAARKLAEDKGVEAPGDELFDYVTPPNGEG